MTGLDNDSSTPAGEISMPGRQEPKGKPFAPMGDGHWSEIVHAANGHRRYGHMACMGCGRETGDSTGSSYVGADGHWYCGTKGSNETCELYANDVRLRLAASSEQQAKPKGCYCDDTTTCTMCGMAGTDA